jgi:hypothetical protein
MLYNELPLTKYSYTYWHTMKILALPRNSKTGKLGEMEKHTKKEQKQNNVFLPSITD